VIWRVFGWSWEVVRRDPQAKGGVVSTKRWIVERMFGWFEGYQRLVQDFEMLPSSSEGWGHRPRMSMVVSE